LRTCHVPGVTGFVAGGTFALGLAWALGLSPRVTTALVATALLGFWTLAVATRFVTGRESLTYYHHEVLALLLTAGVLRLAGQPMLPYLDVMVLAIGLFFVFGRLGCLTTGCCHGRPSRWGVTYGAEHVPTGFPRYLVGVPVFPVQLLESCWVLATTAGGVVLLRGDPPPGSVLAWYTIVYGAGRFVFEWLRGDAGRPYFASFSEAQWTSLLLMSGTALAELAGLLPRSGWPLAAALALAAVMAVAPVLTRRLDQPIGARHLREIGELIEALRASRPEHDRVPIAETSLGIRISATIEGRRPREVELFALSSSRDPLSERSARRLARLIGRLRRAQAEPELVRGGHGVYHLRLERSPHAV
jgi:hypothetical protein